MGISIQHYIPEMLAHQPLFRTMDRGPLSDLAEGAYEYMARKGEFFYQKGEPLPGMHLVISGQVKLSLTNSAGMETIVMMAGPGESFGEEILCPGKHSPVSAQANKDSLVVVLQPAALRAAMAKQPEFAEALLARMGSLMCQIIENLETCVQRSSTQRVAHFLSQCAPEQADSFKLELDMNKSTIASQLNLTPETFSRVLSRLAKEGVIDLKGRCINLRDLGSLRAYAG